MQKDPLSDRPDATAEPPVVVSIGIIAWNEELIIPNLIKSLSAQTLFRKAAARGLRTQVLVVANGCTDATCEVSETSFRECFDPVRLPGVVTHVAHLSKRGKLNAWNQFVHELSAPEARYLILADADITLDQPETLWSMVESLRSTPGAVVSVDKPCKRFRGGTVPLLSAISRSAGQVTLAAPGQLCGQLYCIRSEIARNIYLPRDLAACDDGFIKALVCSDFLTRSVTPDRICLASDASHSFEPYLSAASLLRNQKRQIIGQTIVHLLVDQYLPGLSYSQRLRMAATLRALEATDPDWLKRLIAAHLAATKAPWRLYPGLLTHRFRHFHRLGSTTAKLQSIPGLLAGTGLSLVASCMAYRALKRGCTDYWPRTGRGAGCGRPRPQRPKTLLRPGTGALRAIWIRLSHHIPKTN